MSLSKRLGKKDIDQKRMKNILTRLRLDTKTALLLTLIIGFAAFFRFYKLYEFVTFLGDQGRDALIMRQIVTLKDFPALGPITSVGSIYLGPLYYYMMAPWLLLTNFNPIGPAIGVVIITLVSLILQYFVVRDMINKKTALISVIFSAFSWTLIEYSRFSWNPNLLPYTSLFLIYAIYKAAQTHKMKYFILCGLLLSLAVQLHYLAVFLGLFAALALGIDMFWTLRHTKKNKGAPNLSRYLVLIGSGAAGFVLLLAPFLVFEVIHHFPNANSIINFTHQPEITNGYPYHVELQDTLRSVLQFSFQVTIQNWLVIVLFILFLLFFIVQVIMQSSLTYVLGALFVMVFGIAVYKGPKFVHYLGSTYILVYIATSYMLSLVLQKSKKLGLLLSLVVLALFITVNIHRYYFLYEKNPPNQIYRAQVISQTILSMHPQQPYALTTIPESYSDNVYRYYLGVANNSPITKEEDMNIPTKALFVICENTCDPMGDPQWTIAHFAAQKVEAEKIVPEIKSFHIYKLVK